MTPVYRREVKLNVGIIRLAKFCVCKTSNFNIITRPPTHPPQLGLGDYKVTQDKGTRVNSYRAFIKPIVSRANLTIMTHARVQSIEIEGDTA
ncbi:GMC family oxidoreductase N-terminal domain-containing protein, partial [Candidatus Pseudothioglobus singularis]|nr:GMC family oxidoreductase N-terminal domain-containing protein [Candidatus Pseudothioglobus singularis]